MDKTSKTGQLRALREARITEQGRPAPAAKKLPKTELQRAVDELIAPAVPTPVLKPAKPAKNVATKNKKRAAEVMGKARQASRLDKRSITTWVDPDLATAVKVAAARDNVTIEEWVASALEMKLGVK